MHKQRGFALPETLLALVALTIVGFTGWFVWHTKQVSEASYSSSGQAKFTTPTKKQTTPTPQPGVTPTPTPAPAPTPTPTSGSTTALGDGDDGKTVTASAGSKLTITLSGSYWQFANPSNAAAKLIGTPTSKDRNCSPGESCGTITATYDLVSAGTVTLAASRNACGEALACTPDQATYSVTVVIK